MTRVASRENKVVVLLLAVAFFSALMTPPAFLAFVEKASSHLAALPGVPVSETVFADLARDEPDAVMLQGGILNETQESVFMRVDYNDLPRIDIALAIEVALDFFSRNPYLAEMNLTLDSQWTILDGVPWRLRFLGETDVYISINALSAKVWGFCADMRGSPLFVRNLNKTEQFTEAEVEQKALEFLSSNGYTLSRYARYSGPTLGNHYGMLSHDVFSLSFYNVVNETVVTHNEAYYGPTYSPGPLSLAVDPETGEVVAFHYRWTHISYIPVRGIITPERAEHAAVDYLLQTRNVTGIEIISSALLFERIGSYHNMVFRLCWVVYTAAEEGFVVHIDAVSGSYRFHLEKWIEDDQLQAPSVKTQSSTLPIHYGLITIIGCLIVAVLAYAGARKLL